MLHHRSLVTENTDKLSEHGATKHRFSLSEDDNDRMMMTMKMMMVMMNMMTITMKMMMRECTGEREGEGACFGIALHFFASPEPHIFQAFLNASFKLLSFKLSSQFGLNCTKMKHGSQTEMRLKAHESESLFLKSAGLYAQSSLSLWNQLGLFIMNHQINLRIQHHESSNQPENTTPRIIKST